MGIQYEAQGRAQAEAPDLEGAPNLREYRQSVRAEQEALLARGLAASPVRDALMADGDRLHRVFLNEQQNKNGAVAAVDVSDIPPETYQTLVTSTDPDVKAYIAANPEHAHLFVSPKRIGEAVPIIGGQEMENIARLQGVVDRATAREAHCQERVARMPAHLQERIITPQPRIDQFGRVRARRSPLDSFAERRIDAERALERAANPREVQRQALQLVRSMVTGNSEPVAAPQESALQTVRVFAASVGSPTAAAAQFLSTADPQLRQAANAVIAAEGILTEKTAQQGAYAAHQRAIQTQAEWHELFERAGAARDEETGRAEQVRRHETGLALTREQSSLRYAATVVHDTSPQRVQATIARAGGIQEVSPGPAFDDFLRTAVATVDPGKYVLPDQPAALRDPYAQRARNGLEIVAQQFKEEGRLGELAALQQRIGSGASLQLSRQDLERIFDPTKQLGLTPQAQQIQAQLQQEYATTSVRAEEVARQAQLRAEAARDAGWSAAMATATELNSRGPNPTAAQEWGRQSASADLVRAGGANGYTAEQMRQLTTTALPESVQTAAVLRNQFQIAVESGTEPDRAFDGLRRSLDGMGLREVYLTTIASTGVGNRATPQTAEFHNRLEAYYLTRLAHESRGAAGTAAQGTTRSDAAAPTASPIPGQSLVITYQARSTVPGAEPWKQQQMRLDGAAADAYRQLDAAGYRIASFGGGQIGIVPKTSGQAVATFTVRGASSQEINAQIGRGIEQFLGRR